MLHRIRCTFILFVVVGSLGSACASSTSKPLSPPPAEEEVLEDDPDAYDNTTEASPPPKEEVSEKPSAPSKPEFKPGMSVEEAIKAVPQGAPRQEIEEDVLARPLQDPKVYEPCKVKPTDKFSVRVAVWNGEPVGLDVEAKDQNLASCLREQILKLTWKPKVETLSTISYAQ